MELEFDEVFEELLEFEFDELFELLLELELDELLELEFDELFEELFELLLPATSVRPSLSAITFCPSSFSISTAGVAA